MNARPERVLVAEDDPAMRELIAEVLRADGREVALVATGEEMLLRVRQQSVLNWPEDAFSVIVTDHRMRNGNGLDVVETLRSVGYTTPILLISAFADERMRERADELDTMVLSKPFPLAAIRSAVNVLAALHPSGLGHASQR